MAAIVKDKKVVVREQPLTRIPGTGNEASRLLVSNLQIIRFMKDFPKSCPGISLIFLLKGFIFVRFRGNVVFNIKIENQILNLYNMKTRYVTGLLLLLSLFLGSQLYAQGSLLNKVKNKAEDKAVKKLFGEDEKKDNSSNTNSNTNNSDTYDASGQKSGKSGKSVQNTEGGGITKTPPDVLASIKAARTSFEAKNYVDARYSVKQAIMGVELEIGQNILKGLPEKVDGLPIDPEEDDVSSQGIGFIGLNIHRVYRSEKKEFDLSIMNDASMLMGINMYLEHGGYSTKEDNNTKTVQFNSYRAMLQYDEGSGYTLSVPFGQNSLYMVKGVNYKTEDEFLSIAKTIDLEKIKTELGEK
jgi:hypothetical protein